MIQGLLWFDDNPQMTTAHRIARAAACYRRKHKRMPGVCYVHPLEVGDLKRVGIIRVVSHPTILRNHYLICEEEEKNENR